MTTLGGFVHEHGLIFIALAWAAYVVVVAVQSSKEKAEYAAATADLLTFEEVESDELTDVVSNPPRINQLQAAAYFDALAARKSGGSQSHACDVHGDDCAADCVHRG